MPHAFAIDPFLIGLPTRDELVEMRIWDNHYHGIDDHERLAETFDRMGVEHIFSLDIAHLNSSEDQISQKLALLEKYKDHMSGLIRIDPSRPDESLQLMDRLIRNGPCIGIKYAGHYAGGITCSHPNNDPIIRSALDLNAVVYVHTSINVGGNPRTLTGGNSPGESTPMDLALLAQRFPQATFISGHQGGDWELGIRAVRPHTNIFLEFSGLAPTAGSAEMAVKELGAERLVWGCHAPSRSFATELSKIYSADLTREQRKLIFGKNLRGIAAPILRQKGVPVEV